MDRDKLKFLIRSLEAVVETLKSEIYSDVSSYTDRDDELDTYGSSALLTDYDEVFDDDDGYPD